MHAVVIVVVVTITVGGGWPLLFGDTTGLRLFGVAALLGGAAVCWRGARYYMRPTAPEGDADLEREVRQRAGP